jgi:hypothetical protein
MEKIVIVKKMRVVVAQKVRIVKVTELRQNALLEDMEMCYRQVVKQQDAAVHAQKGCV